MNFFQHAHRKGVGDSASNQKQTDLSMEERERGMQDLHGVSDILQESEATVQVGLRSVRNELKLTDSITMEDRELLKFLRAENFDAKKAAARFNRFSVFRNKLFGTDGKGKFSDLNPEDSNFLQSGFMQLLPQKDRAGRAIIVCIGALKQQLRTSLDTDLRCLSALALKTAEDEEIQKRGIVMVYYAVGQKTYDGRNNRPIHLLTRAFEEFPVRFVATHFCYDSEGLKPLLNQLQSHMEKKMLCRFRSHCGHHAECLYSLMTFGIPKESLPVNALGVVDLSSHLLLLETAKQEEQQAGAPGRDKASLPSLDASSTGEKKVQCERFLIPGHLDIILGRGQHAKNTPGHERFKQLLEANRARYEAAEKSQKTIVAEYILKELKGAGCRFLKPRPEGGWMEVTNDAGKEKINHAFRNLRSSAKKAAASSASLSSPAAAMPTASLLGKRSLQEAAESGRYPFREPPSDLSGAKYFPL